MSEAAAEEDSRANAQATADAAPASAEGHNTELAVSLANEGGVNQNEEAQQEEEDVSAPASPITVNNMMQLLKRDFGDVLKEIIAKLQVCCWLTWFLHARCIEPQQQGPLRTHDCNAPPARHQVPVIATEWHYMLKYANKLLRSGSGVLK